MGARRVAPQGNSPMNALRAAYRPLRARRGGRNVTRSLTLEAQARRAVQRFVRVLAHCGCAPQAIEDEVRNACRGIPKSWLHQTNPLDSLDPGHVMTLWFSDPAYLDVHGNPRPLPARGSPLSIQTLAQRVDPDLDVRYVLRYLQRGGAVKRTGTRYVPRDRVVIFRGREGVTPLVGLFGLLRTLEHNSQRTGRSSGWLELFSRNTRLPVSAVPGFEKRLRILVNRLLLKVDADMHRRERARRKGERTVRMGVGVYQFLEELAPRTAVPRHRPGAAAKRGAG